MFSGFVLMIVVELCYYFGDNVLHNGERKERGGGGRVLFVLASGF